MWYLHFPLQNQNSEPNYNPRNLELSRNFIYNLSPSIDSDDSNSEDLITVVNQTGCENIINYNNFKKLSNHYVSDFLENAILENALIDEASFLEYFYGFYVWANSTNTILYLNPTGTTSKMSIYYHNKNNVDSVLSLDFSVAHIGWTE